MRLLLLAALTALALPAGARAAVVSLAPASARATSVAVASAPDARTSLAAVVTREDDHDLLTVRDGAGGSPQALLRAPGLRRPVVAVGPGGAATVVVARISGGAPFHADLVVLRRPASGSFGAPESVGATDGYADILASDTAADGSVAVVGVLQQEGLLLRARPAEAASTVTSLGRVGTAGIALGDDGRLALATFADGTGEVHTRRAGPGGSLGPEHLLTRLRSRPDLRAAIDARGTATVAFARDFGSAIGVVAARARAGAPFGELQVLDRGPNSQIADLAAAGDTTALAYYRLSSATDPVRVVTVRGSGAFGAPQLPVTPTLRLRGYAGRTPSSANAPTLAVDARGDILLAWTYGPFGSVQASLRPAGAPRFGPRRVLSPLAPGGPIDAALTPGGTPLIAFVTDGGARLATGLGQRSVHRRPPEVTLSPLSPAELRRYGTATTRVRCSASCVLSMRARLTAGTGRSGQRISRQFRPPVVLSASGSLLITFTLPARGRELLAQSGRAQVKVIATASSSSGATSSARVAFDVGR